MVDVAIETYYFDYHSTALLSKNNTKTLILGKFIKICRYYIEKFQKSEYE